MTNAEAIASDLTTAIKDNNEELLECVAEYIACPSEEECNYDGGSNQEPCVICKMKWLRKEFC